jgi:hypothetical protein
MSDDDREVETFLRGFHPRAPGPLPLRRTRAPSAPSWLVAAAVVLAVGALVMTGSHSVERRPRAADADIPATLGALGASFRRGHLEATLDVVDRHALPDPRQAGGVLLIVGDVNRDR